MKKVVVIGGGLSGLSCASYLSDGGCNVTLLEASPKLGGRAYSFRDPKTSDIIDNGQHIMMGCYENTIDFLRLVAADNNLSVQSNLKVPFRTADGSSHYLESKSEHYPFNVLRALMGYSALTLKERLKVMDLFLDLVFIEESDLVDVTVEQWLLREGQDQNTIKALWEILAIGTLNSRINEASAAVFVNVLKQVFLNGNDAAKIILPNVGLSEMYCMQAEKFICDRGGNINRSERVVSIKRNETSLSVKTNKYEYSDLDFIVSAVPLHAAGKIEGLLISNSDVLGSIKYSPIVSAHIWLKENNFTEKFYGLIDSQVHWVFNHDSYISVVTSAAFELAEKEDIEIFNIISCELSKNFPVFFPEIVLSYKIIKEKRATYVPNSGSIKERNKITTAQSNIILCGDWTETMLPATIESAVLSGRRAACKILENEF